ncbi:MAG: hypothetical protein HKO98_13750 [Gemmatimonadetes bacterium]|nr:hypothetical protein [Gemmatimonadota bacterium]
MSSSLSLRALAGGLALGLVGALLGPAAVLAQDEVGWDTPRVLELVDRARSIRQSVAVDSVLRSYRSSARGFVYFFLDRNDSDERTLVKTDQVALDVFWRAPGDTRQRIVGLRDEKSLPTNIQYHLDHLTVVQDEFGDRIRLGDGDEVEAVAHPVSVGAERIYHFRLRDSLTLEFGGGRAPVRVYEMQVRPRDPDQPGFVGSVFLDRSTAAIVRMNFTFTPASYVDPYLDYIRISLDNSLWMDRFWLPYRQEAELRRELPQLDFLAGSVIRGRFEIRDYDFNVDLPSGLFSSRTVLAVPEAERRAFPFEEPIFAGLEEEGLQPSASMEELRAQARQLVRDHALSGLRPARFHWASASDAARYSRAEGVYLGTGTSLRLPADLRLRSHAGWSFGRSDLSARFEATSDTRTPATRVTLEWRAPHDIGPVAPASGLINSLASLAGEDWTDPYFSTGVRVERRFGAVDGPRVTARLGWADERSARVRVGDATGVFRPVRPIEDGIARTVGAEVAWPRLFGPVDASVDLEAARLNGRTWTSAEGILAVRRDDAWRTLDVDLSVRLGLADDPPPQGLTLLGGRNTLPGHDHRALVGDRYWLVQAEIGRRITAPWVGVHLLGSVGRTFIAGPDVLPAGWTGDPDAGVRGSVGLGLDLLWDVLTVDVVRGLGPGGDWALLFGVNPRFHPWL